MPFVKGQSGNPGGRPKALAEWRKSDEAQRLRDLSYKTLEACLMSDTAEWRDKNTAACALLDRIEGKPVQAIGGEDGQPIKLDVGGIAESLRRFTDDGG